MEIQDLQLTATLPSEMAVAQEKLINWCNVKINTLKSEVLELKQAYEHAKKMKWKYTTLQNQHNKANKLVIYYEKMKAALMAGFVIIPNFPVDIFAIRTDKDQPKKYLTTNKWPSRNSFSQEPNQLEVAIGDYKNPNPVLYSKTIDENIKQTWAEEWNDEIEFPINMAKPDIMECTSRAMALKIFDQFGVMPSVKRDDDPVIIGQIVHKRGGYLADKITSFMIVWHLDTKIL